MIPIVEVTLFEDRAQVVRRGAIPIQVGMNQIVLENMSPVLANKTILARLDASAEIVDIRVDRRRVLKPHRTDHILEQRKAYEKQKSELVTALSGSIVKGSPETASGRQ